MAERTKPLVRIVISSICRELSIDPEFLPFEVEAVVQRAIEEAYRRGGDDKVGKRRETLPMHAPKKSDGPIE